MIQKFSVELNNFNYYEGSKCPACSSEKDKGGRLEIKTRLRPFLKCSLCKYSIMGKKTKTAKEKRAASIQGMTY